MNLEQSKIRQILCQSTTQSGLRGGCYIKHDSSKKFEEQGCTIKSAIKTVIINKNIELYQ